MYHPGPVPGSLSNSICWMMARTAPALPTWAAWGLTMVHCPPHPARSPVCQLRALPLPRLQTPPWLWLLIFCLLLEGSTLSAWPAVYSFGSAVIIRHHWNPILPRKLFLLASGIRLTSVYLFRKTSAEAETSISEDDSEALKEPGGPGPNTCLDGQGTVGRSRLPPGSPHLWARRVPLQSHIGLTLEPTVWFCALLLTCWVMLGKSFRLGGHCGVTLKCKE